MTSSNSGVIQPDMFETHTDSQEEKEQLLQGDATER